LMHPSCTVDDKSIELHCTPLVDDENALPPLSLK